eukprot:TRINITY_DN32316_c0_g1_i1.p1 TRINITY_DN32316_c0_g1~~TRINITY_DN32316_c0_g1_i1.p1  ORF type:complete len:274 (-),score=107.68 TRINITY_DN32316_c0_g1_i1:78-899(-)
MGWDDSDDDDEWDADDIEAKIEAQRKEKERERRREEGLDSDSEEEKAKKAAASAPKVKKEKGPSTKKEEKKPEIDPDQVPLADPKAERERLKRLQEQRDARLAEDLFAGFEKDETPMQKEKREQAEAAKAKAVAKPKIKVIDAFEDLELNVQKDIDDLSSIILGKFEKSTLHKGGPVKFISELFKQLEPSLDLKDLEDLNKTVEAMAKDKKVVKGANLQKDNKANTKINKNTKFNADSEWADVYGGGGDDYDEEWTAEEWEAWEKQQAAKAKK